MNINTIQPLVSIGLATYKRPDTLLRVLECITKQSYRNLEIIISDDCTPGDETQKVVQGFMEKDPRIQYYYQEKNLGANHNSNFVLQKATGEYFMWSPDDDYYDSLDLVSKLVLKAQENNSLLVFPNINIVNRADNQIQRNVMTTVFGRCETDREYLIAWCRYGKGFPIYGLFDLNQKFLNLPNNRQDVDIPYYFEGTLIHKAFLHGNVRFVENVSINYINDNSQLKWIKPPLLLLAFVRYTCRVLIIYTSSGLPWAEKIEVLAILLKKHIKSMKTLFAQTVKYYQNLVLHRTVE